MHTFCELACPCLLMIKEMSSSLFLKQNILQSAPIASAWPASKLSSPSGVSSESFSLLLKLFLSESIATSLSVRVSWKTLRTALLDEQMSEAWNSHLPKMSRMEVDLTWFWWKMFPGKECRTKEGKMKFSCCWGCCCCCCVCWCWPESRGLLLELAWLLPLAWLCFSVCLLYRAKFERLLSGGVTVPLECCCAAFWCWNLGIS